MRIDRRRPIGNHGRSDDRRSLPLRDHPQRWPKRETSPRISVPVMSEGAAYAAIARAVIDSTAAPDLLVRQAPAVVLERIARGGGTTNRFLLRTPNDLEALSNRPRPGSCVSFYFDDRTRRLQRSARTASSLSRPRTERLSLAPSARRTSKSRSTSSAAMLCTQQKRRSVAATADD